MEENTMADPSNISDNIEIKKISNEDIPDELPILPLRNLIVFPFTLMPLAIGIPRSEKLIKEATKGNKYIGLVASKDPEIEEPHPGQLYEVGTVATISRVFHTPDNTLNIFVQGLERFKIDHWTNTVPYLTAKINLAPDEIEEGSGPQESGQRDRKDVSKLS
jgi:ATP-dependent Lon protease